VTGGRTGAALAMAVLVSLGGVLLAHAALVLAQAEFLSTSSAVRSLRLEFLAQRAVVTVIEGTRVPATGREIGVDSVAGVDGAARWRGRLRRISPEIWLAEGEAVEGPAARTVALPVWRLDPVTRTQELGAILVTGGTARVEGLSRVTVAGFGRAPGPTPSGGCPPAASADSIRTIWKADPDSGAIALGRLSLASLIGRAGIGVSAVGTPAPQSRLGSCLESSWNWGDPNGFGRPCGTRLPIVDAAPGVVLEGGTGQGLLIARGDLTLRGSSFYGLILVEGVLHLEGPASVTGMVVARGGAVVSGEAFVTGSTCWASAALGVPGLHQSAPILPRRWIHLDG